MSVSLDEPELRHAILYARLYDRVVCQLEGAKGPRQERVRPARDDRTKREWMTAILELSVLWGIARSVKLYTSDITMRTHQRDLYSTDVAAEVCRCSSHG